MKHSNNICSPNSGDFLSYSYSTSNYDANEPRPWIYDVYDALITLACSKVCTMKDGKESRFLTKAKFLPKLLQIKTTGTDKSFEHMQCKTFFLYQIFAPVLKDFLPEP